MILFQYLWMYPINRRDSTNQLVIFYHRKTYCYLSATSNSELFPVDTTNDEEGVVTKYPINTAKIPTSATSTNYTDKPFRFDSVRLLVLLTKQPIL